MAPKRSKTEIVAEIELPETSVEMSIDDFLHASDRVIAINKEIALAEAHLRSLKQAKKRLLNSKSVLTKAQSKYYHQNKTNETIIRDITARLTSGGLLIVKNGKPQIPWRLVREYTDRDFLALSIMDKKKYVEEVLAEM